MPTFVDLQPVEMTPSIMQALEDAGKIIRLAPGRFAQEPGPDNTKDKSLYVSDPKYGPHKLIAVTVNRFRFGAFGTHDDNEEFILVGDPAAKPMYLVVAWPDKEELDRKIAGQELAPEDFVALQVKYNDPEVSFFTMLKDVPHGEATLDVPGALPTFYVTEPAGQTIHFTDFGKFELRVG